MRCVWWKWDFHSSSSFLKATSLICEAQLSFSAPQKYTLWFSHCEGNLGFVFRPIYISVKQEAMAG